MSFCCKCKAGMCKTEDCDSICDCHPQEYPEDKETQEWMNAPLGKPVPTLEEQVRFWSDKYDAKVEELHEMWKRASSFEGSFNSATKSLAGQMEIIDRLTQETFDYKKQINSLKSEVAFLKESRSRWAKQSSENAEIISKQWQEQFKFNYGIKSLEIAISDALTQAHASGREAGIEECLKIITTRAQNCKWISDSHNYSDMVLEIRNLSGRKGGE